jgi:hypothetical protein
MRKYTGKPAEKQAADIGPRKGLQVSAWEYTLVA